MADKEIEKMYAELDAKSKRAYRDIVIRASIFVVVCYGGLGVVGVVGNLLFY